MSRINTYYKDKIARGLGGAFMVILLILQQVQTIDLTFVLFFMSVNLCQFGLTGWCPFCSFFKKIGWLKNYHLIIERTKHE